MEHLLEVWEGSFLRIFERTTPLLRLLLTNNYFKRSLFFFGDAAGLLPPWVLLHIFDGTFGNATVDHKWTH